MVLYMKQKVFSWSEKFYIKDENGADRYFVEGELFSWGRKLHVYAMNGQEVAFVREKIMSLMPTYSVEINGHEICKVVREFTFLTPRYFLEGLQWSVQGDFWAHDYSVVSSKGEEMVLSKEWLTWGDSYGMHIANPANELVCLCVALAIDGSLASSDGNS